MQSSERVLERNLLDREECVECIANADCSDAQRCSGSRCVPFLSCHAERDCANGLHCDLAAGECVACRTDTDCSAKEACSKHECVPRCTQDSDCSTRLPLCGPTGLCGECIAHSDCPRVYHCTANRCELDVCDAGQTCSRSGDAIQPCNTEGDGFDLNRCAASAVCINAGSDGPRCEPKLCTPGAWDCDTKNRYAELCSAHGDAIASRLDCTAEGKLCVDGACAPIVCEPNARHCSTTGTGSVDVDVDVGVLVCNELGTAESLEPCAATEYCDLKLAACAPIVCKPGELACSAETITQCASDGSRFDITPTDCAASGQSC